MKTPIYIKFNKSITTEYITYQGKKKLVGFAYHILDFVSANTDELYNAIANNNSNEIEKLFEKDDMFIVKVFYADDCLRLLKDSKLDDGEKKRKIKILFDDIKKKQLLFSTIINFCFILNTDKYGYDRLLDKFIFICNKLGYTINQPKYSYTITQDTSSIPSTLTLDDINETTLDELDMEYMKFKVNNRSVVNHFENIIYICETIDELFVICMLKIFERKYKVLKCGNCGKLFVPSKKSDALYCDRISPQNSNLNCKKYSSQQPQSSVSKLYKKIYMKKSVRAKRHKDDFTITNEFQNWKTQVDKLRADYNAGTISADEFEKWLLENDK